jgi:phospholipid-binding lipoprotein MlaA
MPLSLHQYFRFLSLCLLLTGLGLLSGCATVQGPGDERDPLESVNRSIFNFNEGFYNYVLDPVTETYQDITPQPVQTGVSNFFSNIGDLFVLVNDLLQFKFEQAASDFSRLLMNTTFGVFGLFDVATYMELPKHHEDFGQTLATWGLGNGPYLVLPFLGPSTLRDTGGLVVDSTYDPILDITDDEARWATIGLKAVDIRLPATPAEPGL